MKLCPVKDCDGMLLPGHHFCPKHWRRVTSIEGRKLSFVYRKWSGCDDPTKRGEREAAYRRQLAKITARIDNENVSREPTGDAADFRHGF